MVELFLSAFITLFVIIDPPGCAPIYAGLTTGASDAQRRSMAWRACAIAFAILLFFLLLGEQLLGALHIELDSFRIAGGLMLFLIALDMVFEKRTERRGQRADDHISEHENPDDISVFPVGIPMLAGPGSIATAMLFMSNASGDLTHQGVVLGAIAVNLVLCLIIFLAAGPLVKMMGEAIAGAITRIFGVILAALSVQLLIDGLKGAFLA